MVSGILLLSSFVLAKTEPAPVNGTAVAANFKTLIMDVVGRFATSVGCDKILENRKYDCAWACSGPAAGTQFLVSRKDDATTGIGMVVKNDNLKTIFVTFRGSDKFRDWLLNGYFRKAKTPYERKKGEPVPPGPNDSKPASARIHAGFKLQYSRLRDRILNDVLTAATQNPGYRISFVGHSLGGALTVLAAVDFYEYYGYGDRISVYTFGSPRVGNVAWATYVDGLPFGKRIFRIQRRGDPFHYLPPVKNGYRHSGKMYLVMDDQSVLRCINEPGNYEATNCMDKVALNPMKHREYFGQPRC